MDTRNKSRRGASNREALLFLSAFLPSPVSGQAGQKTAFRHLTWLTERYDIWFIGFRNEADRPDDEVYVRELCHEAWLFPMDWGKRITGALMRRGLPVVISARWRPGVARLICELGAQHDFARVHCEWSQMAEYLPLLGRVPQRWISAHDVVFQFCERAALIASGPRRLFWAWETRRAARWEADRYRQATSILLHSSKDADLIRRRMPELTSRLKTVQPYFERYRAQPRRARPDGPVLLFWGAMARPENCKAALWLARELMPEIVKHLPTAQLVLAGSNPPEAVRACASDRVLVTGFVKEPQSVFDAADIAVLPLFRGAGIKVKVLECLTAGLPVLTTAIGAEGIAAQEQDGLQILEATTQLYAACLRECWQAPGRLEQLNLGALAWRNRLKHADKSVLLHL